jgi:hypothetical protein
MTIESNRRRRERYMRRHGWWPAWHWPTWDRWGWGPNVTVVREYEHPYYHRYHRYRDRNMMLWLFAILIILILAGVIAVSYKM